MLPAGLAGRGDHLLVGVFGCGRGGLLEGEQFPRTAGGYRSQRQVEFPAPGAGGVDGEGELVQGTGDVHLAAGVDIAEGQGIDAAGQGDGVHLMHAHVRVHPDVVQFVQSEADAAREAAAASLAVGDIYVLEMQAVLVQGQGTVGQVGDAGEVQGDAAVVQPQVLAAQLQLVQLAVQLHLAGEGSAELVEDAAQEVLGITQLEAVQLKGYLGFAGGRDKVGFGLDAAASVHAVLQLGVEALGVGVPGTAEGQLAQTASGDVGGVADNARQQARHGTGR